jgi:ATPase subunit of ABC transporter with duplicated ATPase domains
MNDIYARMGDMSDDDMTTALEKAADLQDTLDNSDFYLIDAKVDEIARGLGLGDLLDKDVADLWWSTHKNPTRQTLA